MYLQKEGLAKAGDITVLRIFLIPSAGSTKVDEATLVA